MSHPTSSPSTSATCHARPGTHSVAALPSSARREAGFSAIVVVLLSAVVMVGVLTTTAKVTMVQRRNSSNEYAAFQAVLASESGQETFVARSAARPFGSGRPACVAGNTDCFKAGYTEQMNAYLAGLGTVPTLSGSAVLTAQNVTVSAAGELTGADVLSVGTSGTDSARVVRSYSLSRVSVPFPHIPGAVTSYPSVTLNGNSSVAGRTVGDPDNSGVVLNFLNVQNSARGFLVPGVPVSVTVSGPDLLRAGQLVPGQYVRLPTVLPGNLPGPAATFRYGGLNGDQLSLTPVPGLAPTASLAGGTLPLADILNGVGSSFGTNLSVTGVESFYVGDEVSVTVAGVTYTTTVATVSTTNGGSPSALTTRPWSPPGMPTVIPEGAAVIKSTNAVVTAGGYTGSKNMTDANGAVKAGGTGGGLITSPLDNALFKQLLNTTPADMKGMSNVYTASSFPGTVNGLSWLETGPSQSVQLNGDPKFGGSGILVVDGDLTINNTGSGGGCAFNGVLVVRGNFSMKGNIEICGAIIVEGAVLVQDGLNATGLDSDNTDFNGTGQKVSYDPLAILDAINNVGPFQFSRARNWRQQ